LSRGAGEPTFSMAIALVPLLVLSRTPSMCPANRSIGRRHRQQRPRRDVGDSLPLQCRSIKSYLWCPVASL
jgi:hypothetical protein